MAQAFTRRPPLRRLGGWLWQLVRGASAVVGMLAAGVELGRTSLACSLVCMWLLGVVVLSLFRSAGSRAIGPRWVLAAGLLAMSWLGLVLFFGVAGAVWAGALALSSEPVRRLWSMRRLRPNVTVVAEMPLPAPEPSVAPPILPRAIEAPAVEPEVCDLSTDELCLAWRRSFLLLADAALPSRRAAIVLRRSSILDEMHKRDPQGLESWLASSPRAAGNPLPFLGSPIEAREDDHLGGDAA